MNFSRLDHSILDWKELDGKTVVVRVIEDEECLFVYLMSKDVIYLVEAKREKPSGGDASTGSEL